MEIVEFSGMDHGMTTDNARRVRLTGSQLKLRFLSKYCVDGILDKNVDLVQSPSTGTVIVKSGMNWQFRLGKFEELIKYVDDISHEGKLVVFRETYALISVVHSDEFLNKYAFTSTFFVARCEDKWQIFLSEDIINLIRSKFEVRILPSGRIKFDYHGNGKTIRGVMTIEYRAEEHKKSFVFGAHGGGSGERLRSIFAEELIFTEVPF